MNEFIYLSALENRNINLQIIKSFSFLILSISNPQTLYYIFSNNFIYQILTNDYEKYDEEFVSHYVNFLKSLTSKLDTTTIQFFFHKHYNSFPLCQAALKLYNYPDSMIKNTVRNIVLTLLKLKYDPIIDYFSSLPAICYFPFLSLSVRDLIIKLNDEIMSDDPEYNGLHSVQDDIIIDILFFQDIFSLKITKVSLLLKNSLFYYTILPLLCGSLVSVNRPRIAISTSLYIMILFFEYIQDESFINTLYAILFLNKISWKINSMINEYPAACKNFYSEWKDQKKSSYLSYFDYICQNFSEPFINLIVSNYTNFQGEELISDYHEINNIKKKVKKKFENGFDITNNDHYQTVLQEVLKHMSKGDLDIMISFHKNLGIATGVNVGLYSDDYRKHSVLMIMHKMFYKIKAEQNYLSFLNEEIDNFSGGSLKSLNLTNNEVKQNIYSYLRSKDDTLIILVSLLFSICHKKNICLELQCVCGLAKAEMHKNSNYDTTGVLEEIFTNNTLNEKNEKNLSEMNEKSENNNNSNNMQKNFVDINLDFINSNNNETQNENNSTDLNQLEFLNFSNKNSDNEKEIEHRNSQNFDGTYNDNTNVNSNEKNLIINEVKDINSIFDFLPSQNTSKKQLEKNKDIMAFYENIPKDNLNFDNKFINMELKGAEQTSYDCHLIDSLLGVILILFFLNYFS